MTLMSLMMISTVISLLHNPRRIITVKQKIN